MLLRVVLKSEACFLPSSWQGAFNLRPGAQGQSPAQRFVCWGGRAESALA